MPYIELHARSAYSFLRGASLPEHLVKAAEALGMSAMALCDRNGLYGAPRFQTSAREQNTERLEEHERARLDTPPPAPFRPITGCELTMADGTVLPVLVENQQGYTHLCTLLSRGHLRAAKGEFALGWEELRGHTEGLVALTGDEEGPLRQAEDPGAVLSTLR